MYAATATLTDVDPVRNEHNAVCDLGRVWHHSIYLVQAGADECHSVIGNLVGRLLSGAGLRQVLFRFKYGSKIKIGVKGKFYGQEAQNSAIHFLRERLIFVIFL
ncbi:hypothetical protein SDC9_111223 [bioreactor metagenome]|uniref:Uncharacterized protein n=1 Tax=bioreactor metagenome TaxID=1076179 RepID=A0A645BG69_9ZZZZ